MATPARACVGPSCRHGTRSGMPRTPRAVVAAALTGKPQAAGACQKMDLSAAIDEIVRVSKATNYAQDTTPEQRERIVALYEEIAAAAPENTVADPRIWGTWRMLWASDNKYRGPFGKGPIAPFYRVKDLTQSFVKPDLIINENFLAHVGIIPAQTWLQGQFTVEGPKDYIVQFTPGKLTVGPVKIDSPRPPPTIAGEVSYVDDRIRLLRGRSIKTNQEVPTYFVFERVVDDSKGLSAAERAARSA